MGLRSSSLEIWTRAESHVSTVFTWRGRWQTTGKNANLQLGVGPAGNLNHHVQDGLLRVGVQRDIVEGGDGNAILLDVHPVLEGVGRGDLADGVGRHVADGSGRRGRRG